MRNKTFNLRETQIIEALCNGLDPDSGEPLNTPKSPDLDALRIKFYDLLQRVDRRSPRTVEKPKKPQKESRLNPDARQYKNSGVRWNPELDADLLERWLRDDVPTLETISDEIERSPLSLAFRLVHLGQAVGRESVFAMNQERRVSKGFDMDDSGVDAASPVTESNAHSTSSPAMDAPEQAKDLSP